MSEMEGHFDTDQPWVVWWFGLTHDKWWPAHNSTRVLGRARVVLQCAVCGHRETISIKIPRFGKVPIPKSGKHTERERFLAEHAHPDRGAPFAWAMPLLNPEAHPGGLSLDQFAMRLEADLNEGDDE